MHHLVKLVVPSSLHRGHRLGSSTQVNTVGEFTLFVLATLADAPSSQVNTVGEFTLFVLATLADAPSSQVSCTQRTQTRIINTSKHSR